MKTLFHYLPFSRLLAGVLGLLLLTAATSPLRAQTCTGNIILSTQAQVDAFNCTMVTGNLDISGSDITNLDGLSELTIVGGFLIIYANPSLMNVDGLSGLSSVGGYLSITVNSSLINVNGLSALSSLGGNLAIGDNNSLTNVDGLSGLNSVSGDLVIYNNANLMNVDGLANLSSVSKSLFIRLNDGLTNVDGLSALNSLGAALYIDNNNSLTNVDGLSDLGMVGAELYISDNPSLTNVDGLSGLSSVGEELSIYSNSSLINLNGLSGLSSVGKYLSIVYNPVLSDCCGIYDLISKPGAVAGTITINNNASGCDSEEEIEADCNTPPTALCRAVTVNAGAGCQGAAAAMDFDNGSSDPDNDPLTFSVSPAGPYALGMTNVTLTVSDGEASSTCQTIITVEDNADPIANTASLPTVSGQCSATVSPPTTTDNCAGTVTGTTDDPLTYTEQGTYTITWTYDDGNGNTSTQTQTVVVNENISAPTCTGDVVLSTQAEVDAFDCGTVTGNLTISGADITNLSSLCELTSVGGYLYINNNPSLTNVDGLSALSTVSGELEVGFNGSLTNVDGLSALSNVGGGISIYDNGSLTNVDGLSALTTVGGKLEIQSNDRLTNVDGLSALTTVGGYLDILFNDVLTDVDGLSALSSVGEYVFIASNYKLTNVDGLSALSSVGDDLRITDNEELRDCCGIYDLISNPGAVAGSITINNNASGCDSEAEIEADCNHPPLAQCQALTVAADANCQATAAAADFDDDSSDPDMDELTFSVSPAGPYALGTTPVTLTVSDGEEIGTCETTITVEDNTAPTVSCSGGAVFFNGETSFPVTDAVTSSAMDACGVSSGPSFAPAVVTCSQVGQNVAVVVSYSDATGNVGRCTTSVQVNGLPCGFEDARGIGCSSQSSYNVATGTFTLQTNGCNNTNPNSDQIGFIGYELCGNGSISLRVASVSSSQVFAGIALRASLDPGAVKAEVFTNRSYTGRAAVRSTPNGPAWPTTFPIGNRYWLKLERIGNQVRIYTSADGLTWTVQLVRNLSLPNCVQIGLAAYGPGTATFDHVVVNGGNAQLSSSPQQATSTTPAVDKMQAFPNPTSGRLTIRLPDGIELEGAYLEIIDSYGRLLHRETILDHDQPLDLSRLKAGAYLLRLQTARGERLMERILVQR